MSEPEQDRPLHVRVAEALGWTGTRRARPYSGEESIDPRVSVYYGRPHEDAAVERIPDYDTDWSAGGPLLERYGIDVDAHKVGNWTAQLDPYTMAGHTPLEAVCNLVLALAEAGKLPR